MPRNISQILIEYTRCVKYREVSMYVFFFKCFWFWARYLYAELNKVPFTRALRLDFNNFPNANLNKYIYIF